MNCGSRQKPSREKGTYTSYLPFYGGAKGQYLEVTKDSTGQVIKQRIVSENEVITENIVKSTDETLISKVLKASLLNTKTLAEELLKIHDSAIETGKLSLTDKEKFIVRLNALGETASNLAKIILEIGEDVSLIFQGHPSENRNFDGYNEDVGEEGIGVDNIDYPPQSPIEDPSEAALPPAGGSTSVAEARPVGLAVAGEGGVAHSKPIATAVVSANGLAVARPVATAIAGVDPAALGLTFNAQYVNKV